MNEVDNYNHFCENDNRIYDCIIVGAGISGISFAHHIKRTGKKVLILDEASQIGGRIQTEISETDTDYWREMGAHTCYNSYTHLISLLDDIDYTENIQPLDKAGFVTYQNKQIRSIFSQISLVPLMLNGSKIFFSKKENKTVKEFFRPIVGADNYDRLFSKLFRAVISQQADDYPADLFLKRRNGRRKDIVRKFSMKEGLQDIVEALIEKNNLFVQTGIRIVDVRQIDGVYELYSQNGTIYRARSLSLACDPQTASVLLKVVNSELADLLASISLFKSESINIVVNKKCLSIAKVAGIIPLSDVFFSAVSRDLVEHPELRSFTFHFKKSEKTTEEQLDAMCEVLAISRQDILEQVSTTHVLPSLQRRHSDLVQQINTCLSDLNIYLLGNYFYGLSLEDCAHRSMDEARRFK